NQLVKEDITKGYDIAGTGEIDFDGNVLRIGGVDKKVVAAHKKDIDIFFAPYEQGDDDSNYELAKQTAKAIKTNMEIVPIDTFADALTYLDQLEPKEN
ncbi:MAG TPA: S16 family serine protease, partial [Pseudogracilibacillus sp.]|nr:S16 family serine protease [Pseudogracilibacillus sp.]